MTPAFGQRHYDGKKVPESPIAFELQSLIQESRVRMLGVIRQELLSGIRSEVQFSRLKELLRSFPDLPIVTEDYENAAEYYNICRKHGFQGSNADFLICAVAVRQNLCIYTTDKDFELYAQYLPIVLYNTSVTASTSASDPPEEPE